MTADRPEIHTVTAAGTQRSRAGGGADGTSAQDDGRCGHSDVMLRHVTSEWSDVGFSRLSFLVNGLPHFLCSHEMLGSRISSLLAI